VGLQVCWWLWVCGFAGDGSVRAARRGGTRGCGFAGFSGLLVMGR
jgi:hypothetical protein